jgi:hypothetical protein
MMCGVSSLGVPQTSGLSGSLLLAIVAGGIAASWIAAVFGRARHERALLKAHARAGRAKGAAIEAAEENPLFDPDEIKRSIENVVLLGGALWRANDASGLDDRPDAHLIAAWARSREAWLGGALEVEGEPSVDLLEVVNRGSESEDRVIARVRLHVHCDHPRPYGEGVLNNLTARHRARLDERWTLGRGATRWLLLSVDGDPLAGPVLSAPLVATRSADLRRLQEQSLAELASAEKVPQGVALSDLIPPDEPPALALLDLSLVDGRFSAPLIAAQLGHLVEAWEEASTGSDAPLLALASNEAASALLSPAAGKRLVVRDAVLRSWHPVRLDLSARTPAVEIGLDVEAVRYVATADLQHLAGNADEPHRMRLTWVLKLTDSPQTPWRLITADNPAEPIPGWP